MDKLKFVTRFPYLIEIGPNKFTGILHLKDESIGINFTCPQFPSTVACKVELNRNNKLIEYSSENQKTNAYDFVQEMENELKRNATSPTTHADDIATYQTIFEQLRAIDGDHSFKLSKDYKTVTFSELPDHPGHYLELCYNQLTSKFHVQRHSLPNRCGALKGRTVSEFLDGFRSELGILEEFYGNLADIDELCFVIAPVPVTTKDAYRIFKFNDKVFLKVTLDPYVPSNVQLNFIGPLEEVEVLRRIYCQKMDDWDVEVGAYKNLLRMFDLLYFPYRPDCQSQENQSCSICFEFNLENTYPIITCFNANCEVVFHAACLQQWFETLADTKTFCTVTSGLCPYCKQKLTMFVDICDAAAVE